MGLRGEKAGFWRAARAEMSRGWVAALVLWVMVIGGVGCGGRAVWGAYVAGNTFDLNPVTGFTTTTDSGTNGLQQAGSGLGTNTSNNTHAMIWNGTAFTDLNPSGYTSTVIFGVGATQQVGYGFGTATSGVTHALLWTGSVFGVVDLGPSGFTLSQALATTGTQQVGFGFNSVASNFHALLWNNTAASAVDLNPTGFTVSQANGTNGTMQVGFGAGAGTGGNNHALLWLGTASSATDLNPLSGYTTSQANGVGGNQQVGLGAGTATGGNNQALLWTGTAGSFVNLNPTGFTVTTANATNGSQQVGYGHGTATAGNDHALVWSGTAASFVDLNALVAGGATASTAQAIDIYGNIAGSATVGGNAHAVVWYAGDVFTGSSTNWGSSGAWTSGVPTAGADVLVTPTNFNTQTVNYAGGPALGKVTVDNPGGGSVQVTVTGGTLAATSEVVGVIGQGTIAQGAGTQSVTGSVMLGQFAGATGVMLLSGTEVFNAGGSFYVGGSNTAAGGSGNLTVSGGTATVTGTLKLWDSASSSVTLSGGTLAVGGLDTNGKPSRFHWTGGTLSLTGGLLVDVSGPLGSTLSLASGQTLATTGTVTNNGTVALSGGAVNGLVVNNTSMTGFGSVTATGFTNNGQVTVSGGNLAVATTPGLGNFGTITLGSGTQLQLSGGNLVNDGTVNLGGGTVNGSAGLTNNTDGVVVGPGNLSVAFTNSGTLSVPDGTTKTGSFTNNGIVEMAGGAAVLSSTGGATITNAATIEGHGKISDAVTNNGTLEATGGTLILNGAVTNGGLIRTATGTKVLMQGGFSANPGIISLAGGTFDNGGGTLNNTGQITGFGVVATGGLTNNGSMTLTGGATTVNGAVTNSVGKTINVKFQPAIFTGAVTNNGTIKVTDTSVTFAGSYTGTNYISDPSDNIFQADVTVVGGGNMSGGSGDRFFMSGGTFTNQGTFSNAGVLASDDLVVNAGNFSQSGPLTQNLNFTNTGTMVLSGTQNWGPGSVFTNSGTATFQTDAGSAAAANLTIHVTGGTVNLGVAQHLAGLTMDAAGGGTFVGTTDVMGNSILLKNGGAAITALRDYLKAGYAAGGWNGTGLRTSVAAAGEGIGYMDATSYGILHPGQTFLGTTLTGTEALLKLTWLGDADLDGRITMNDYAQIEAGFLIPAVNPTWVNGDFNYDGVVNYQDYAMIDWAFANQGGGTLANDMIALHTEEFGGAYVSTLEGLGGGAAVPEPGTAGTIGLGLLVVLRRLKRS